MPELDFQVEGAAAVANAASPQVAFRVRVSAGSEAIHSIALRVQVQIEPVRRRYTDAERAHLTDLFGEPERWSKTVQPILWENVSVPVPGFVGTTVVDVSVSCTFDFNIAVTKYIYGLEEGEIPTTLLFSGTVFFAGFSGLQVAQIPWHKEASYRLPIAVWKQMMELYYPRTAWLAMRRDVFERLFEFKSRHGLATWEQTLDRLLELSAEVKS